MDYYANDFSNQINSLDKEKTYYIYCRSGTRSGNALNIFKNLGFKEVYDLKNGINSWKKKVLRLNSVVVDNNNHFINKLLLVITIN